MVIFPWLLGNSAEGGCVIDVEFRQKHFGSGSIGEYEIQERLLPVLSEIKQTCKEVIE